MAPKTCTVCGITEGEESDHAWTEVSCAAPKTCKVCEITEGDALEHTWEAASCTAPKTCSACGATEGSANEHLWKAASCTLPRLCLTCHATDGSPIVHTWSGDTCTVCKKQAGAGVTHSPGSNLKCSRCNMVLATSKQAPLAATEFQRIKGANSAAKAIHGYIKEFTDAEGRKCNLITIAYQVEDAYLFDHTVSIDGVESVIHDPVKYYTDLAKSATGDAKHRYQEQVRIVKEIIQVNLTGDVNVTGEYLSHGLDSTGVACKKTQTTSSSSTATSKSYLKKLTAYTGIYAKASYNSKFVGYVGKNGTYTIVKEAFDEYGYLWGKLKSGLGWVCLG